MRVPLGCLVAGALAPAVAAGQACPGGQPPLDAAPVSAQAERFVAFIQGERPTPVAQSALVAGGFCVTDTTVFVDAALLSPAALQGPPGRAQGYTTLAFILGRNAAWHAGQSGDAATSAAARAAGCALHRAGVVGRDLTERATALRDAFGGGLAAFLAELRGGYDTCAP